MDTRKAAENTLLLLRKAAISSILAELDAPAQSLAGTGFKHIAWMLDEVIKGKITDEKAHRWLGYVQGYLVCVEMLSLTDCKYANLFA